MTERVTCKATTSEGLRCMKDPKPGLDYCKYHQRQQGGDTMTEDFGYADTPWACPVEGCTHIGGVWQGWQDLKKKGVWVCGDHYPLSEEALKALEETR